MSREYLPKDSKHFYSEYYRNSHSRESVDIFVIALGRKRKIIYFTITLYLQRKQNKNINNKVAFTNGVTCAGVNFF